AKGQAEEERNNAAKARDEAKRAEDNTENRKNIAIEQRNIAERARAEALSRELASYSTSLLQKDTELSFSLAFEAAQMAPTAQAEEALKQGLFEARLRKVIPNLFSFDISPFSPDGKLVLATSFGSLRIWD